MRKKPIDRPHHVIKTNNPAYRFSSGKAAESKKRKFGTVRKSAPLPTSLDELKQRFDDLVYKEGSGAGDGLRKAFEEGRKR